MKFSTIMAVFAVTLAVVATGCKYDKAGAGAGADDAAKGQDIGADQAGGQDVSGLESGSISSASEGRFEDLYTRCTDVEFEAVYFGFDSTVVAPAELPKVDEVVRHLNEKTDRVVVVEGNCDERGSSEYNMSLGENRAIIVRNCLVNGGIAADRIQTRSYGAEKPAVDGHDESAWSRNRRAEFAIFQK